MERNRSAIFGNAESEVEQAQTDEHRAVHCKDRMSVRQLPHDFPPYQTVYSFFSREAKSGLWEKILTYLVGKSRKDTGKSAEPHYTLIDAQSVKFLIWQTPVTWRSAIKRPSLRTRPATMDWIACSAQGLPSRAWNSKKTGTYYLTIVEKESGTVVGRVEFTIDIAFVNDFDF